MIRTKKRMRLCVALLILNLLFIWGNSMMAGDVSASLSDWVGKLLSCIFPIDLTVSSPGYLGLRKFAHLFEFTCLGMILSWLFAMLGKRGVHAASFPLLCGLAAACADEMIQVFTPGRGPGLTDVMIDTLGVALGIALILIGHAFVHKKIKT